MTTVSEVSVKISADLSSFSSAMRSAARAADELKRTTDLLGHQTIDANSRPLVDAVKRASRSVDSLQRDVATSKDQTLDANTRPFIDAVQRANRSLDSLQADAAKPITVRGRDSGGRFTSGGGGGGKGGGGDDGGGGGKGKGKGGGFVGGIVGGALATGAIMAVGQIQQVGEAAVMSAAEFESAMSQMKQASGANGTEMKGLSDLAMQMGAETIFSAQAAAGAMVELAKGGMTPAQIQAGGLKSTLSLAAASGMDMATSAIVMNSTMQTFGLSAAQSNSAVDALAGAANASSADVSDLAQGLAQTGQAASGMGMTVQDTTAVLAAFADAGVKGSDAGTSLKTFLQRMVPQSDAAKDAMKKLNLTFFDAKGKMKPIGQIAGDLQKSFAGLSQEQKSAAMTAIFGADASRAAAILAKNGAKGIDKYTQATSDQGTAAEAATARMGPMATAFEQISGSIETLQLTLGQALAPAITAIAQAMLPLVNQLSGPLAELGGSMGKMMSDVFGAIAPLLGPLMSAVSALAGVFTTVLSTAISMLIPIITPLLGILVTLAQNIGPILVPLMGKIAGLFSAILGAVMPLLPPLIQLVSDILGTAAPIIMVVADAAIELVGALTPVLGAIAPLLPLVGSLVTLLGGVLTPLLQLLVPVIGAVADVLGNVLARAVGLTQAGIGGLIWVFSRVAPFVLNNVVIPVVGHFVSMAQLIVAAAADAFGWVPGLGDKLEGARDAIGSFGTGAITSMQGAATQIAVEGDRMATAMMDTGREMLVNGPPAANAAGVAFGTSYAAGMNSTTGTVQQAAGAVNTSTLAGIAAASGQVQAAGEAAGAEAGSGVAAGVAQAQGAVLDAATATGAAAGTGVIAGMTGQAGAVASGAASLASAAQSGLGTADLGSAGREAGSQMANGLLSSLRGRAGEVAAAAYALGQRAAQAVKNGAQVRSPSQITIEAGRGIADGVRVGLGQRAGSALSAAAAFGALVGQNASTGIAMGRARARFVKEATFDAADKEAAVAEARKAVKKAKGAAAKAKAQRDLTRAIWEYGDAVRAARAAGADFDSQFKTAALDAATERLDKLKDKAREVVDAMLGFGKVTSLAVSNGVKPMAGAIVSNLQQRLAAVRAFGDNLKALRAAGLNDAALQDIIAEGPIAGNQYAEALLADLNSGGSAISSINTLRSDLVTAAGAIGDVSALSSMNADNPYAGSTVASSTVNVNNGAVVINIDGSVSTADRQAITKDVQTAVTAALAELAREVARR